jgi:LysR family transcriptional regulator, transcriptional activator for dmlA
METMLLWNTWRSRLEDGDLDAISDFELFRSIVDAGGISAGALALQSSPAAVSRRLSELERKLGVRLAERSSRRFRLTDEGALLYERSRAILESVRDAEAEISSRGGAARGLLKIGAPIDKGRRHIAPIVATFTARHPGLQAHLVISDVGLEVGDDGLDLVLRYGLPNDPTVIARRFATTQRLLCASPAYLAQRGIPETPENLTSHSCLRLGRRHQLLDRWHCAKGEKQYDIKASGSLSTSDGAVLRDWALAGEGISLEACWDVADDLAAGRLVRLLSDYQFPDIELYAVFAPGRPIPARIRLFIDHLVESFRSLQENG